MSCRCDALRARIRDALVSLSVGVLSRYRSPDIVVAVVSIVVVVVVVVAVAVAVVSAVFVHPGSFAPPPPELPEDWGGVFGDDEVPRVAREVHGPRRPITCQRSDIKASSPTEQ